MRSPSPVKRLGDHRNFHCATNLTINFDFGVPLFFKFRQNFIKISSNQLELRLNLASVEVEVEAELGKSVSDPLTYYQISEVKYFKANSSENSVPRVQVKSAFSGKFCLILEFDILIL